MPRRPRQDAELVARLKALGEQYPRYGYRVLHSLFRAQGLVGNRKRTHRLYTEMGMQLRTKYRNKLVCPRVPMAVPTQPNERWSMDFVHGQRADGRRIRNLNIVNDYTRICVGQLVSLSISGARVVRYLDQLSELRGLPKTLVMGNGPEMTSKSMFFWSQKPGVKLGFIQPGKHTQNVLVESLNGRFRDGCLSQQWTHDLADERRSIDSWREHYKRRCHTVLWATHHRRYSKLRLRDTMQILSNELGYLQGRGYCRENLVIGTGFIRALTVVPIGVSWILSSPDCRGTTSLTSRSIMYRSIVPLSKSILMGQVY